MLEKKDDKSHLVFDGYELPEVKEIIIDKETGKAAENVTPYDRIKVVAEKEGIALLKPNPKCKSCYGRGYTGFVYEPKNKGKEIAIIDKEPVPCTCLFTKEQKATSYPIVYNRDSRRKIAKESKKEHKRRIEKAYKEKSKKIPEINIISNNTISGDKN